MLNRLGEKWYFLDNTYKPWPSCRWTHYPLTIFERLLKENHLKAGEIERITVHCHAWGVSRRFANKQPDGMISCEYNHPHALAMLALGTRPGPSWYAAETLRDPAVQAFRNKVEVDLAEESLDCEKWYEDGQMRKLPTRLMSWLGDVCIPVIRSMPRETHGAKKRILAMPNLLRNSGT